MQTTRNTNLTKAAELCRSLTDVLEEVVASRGGPQEVFNAQETQQRETEVAHLMVRANRLRNLALGPVSRVPVEVLSNIFSLSTDEEQDRFLRAISSVCYHWRTVALRTSPLWRRIVLGSESGRSYDHFVTWLERSGGFNLTLVIRGDPAEDEIASLIKLMSSADARTTRSIRSVQWRVTRDLRTQWNPDSAIIDLLACCGRSLQELIIEDPETLHITQGTAEKIGRLRFDMLQDVTLKNIPLPTHFTAFQTCRSLNLWNVSSAFALPLLQACAGLEWLQIAPRWVESYPDPQQYLFSLPRLGTLLCHLGEDPSPVWIFNALRTPTLHTLVVRLPWRAGEPIVYDAFRSFLDASGCPLTSVTFLDWKAKGVLDVLPNMPQLSVLTLGDNSRQDVFEDAARIFKGLRKSHADSSTALCPQLERIHISPHFSSTVTFPLPRKFRERLVQLLRLRFDHPVVKRIRCLELNFQVAHELRSSVRDIDDFVELVACSQDKDEYFRS